MNAQFCPECGTALDQKGHCQNPDCIKFTTSQKKSSAPRPNLRTNTPNMKNEKAFSEKGKLIVPDCVKSDQDEVSIKQYDIARLQTLIKGAFAEGRLQVTNKRVLFRSSGHSLLGPTSMQHEFSIEEIAGIEIRKESRFNFFSTVLLILATLIICAFLQSVFAHIYNVKFLGVIFTLILAAVSVFVFFLFRKKALIRHLALSVVVSAMPLDASDVVSTIFGDGSIQNLASLVIGLMYFINLLFLAFAPNLVVNIKTKGGTPSVEIRRKDGLFSFQHNEYTGFSQVTPGPDVDLAMHELGAVIREVQQTGIYCETQSRGVI